MPKPAPPSQPVVSPKPAPQAQPAATAKPAPPAVRPKPAPAPAAEAPPVPARATGFSADWLLKQPRGAYTLQLAGVRDRASAVRFIQHHGLGAEATILTTRRDGQAWYVLVHGYYPTRQAALATYGRAVAYMELDTAHGA